MRQDEIRMETQTVLVGLGGTGSRVVNNVAAELRNHSIAINDGKVTCVVMDTNQGDNSLISSSGTQIPVVATCDNRRIREYLKLYANKNPGEWCPYNAAFGEESMIDGASEIRVKSRIAFMDTMLTRKINDLQDAIGKVFHNRAGRPEKVRVMLVSSLAGGTGSGMFIQVALWLRKFFSERNCEATIRGILLLPDIFIRTLDVADNARKKLYYYANAYAAIRELNSINMVVKGKVTLEEPMIIDDLFDSRKPGPQPVFDNAFFIDDVDAGGASFSSLGEYERIVAQIVYMQLYAPMYTELYSVEDNLFRAFNSSKDPVYGSCGTSRAVYPSDSVLDYCALTAARESISDGWYRIDAEIDDMVKEYELAKKDGQEMPPVIRKDKFVELFDEKTQKKEKVGREDQIFVEIKNDPYNETRRRTESGDTVTEVTCKVATFMQSLNHKVNASVERYGNLTEISMEALNLKVPNPKTVSTKMIDGMKGWRAKEEEAIESILEEYKEKVETYADKIVRAIVPLDMGSVNEKDVTTLYGLFVKEDAEGNKYFVHPIAAKYILYKLSRNIERELRSLAPDDALSTALEGSTTPFFNNPKTKKVEALGSYWKDIGIPSKSEILFFAEQYAKYNAENVNLCRVYEKQLLTRSVLKKVNEMLNALIKEMEGLFEDLSKLLVDLDKRIAQNCMETNDNSVKNVFVYGKAEHKAEIYASLNIDLSSRDHKLNKDVVDSVYGKFCSVFRPNANEEFLESSITENFEETIISAYKDILKDDSQRYKNQIFFDIITALEKESDYNYVQEFKRKNKNKDVIILPGSADTLKRHKEAILNCRDSLVQQALPFLIAEPDESLSVKGGLAGFQIIDGSPDWMVTSDGYKLHMPIQTKLTFWGFHPDVVSKFPEIDSALGSNTATAVHSRYGNNELYCYSSIYGVTAPAISKFRETEGGDYYKHYDAVITTMNTPNGSEIDTPHLDKNWHRFLPYVSAEKQEEANRKFYQAFWRATAYGRLVIDHDKFHLIEYKKDSYGNRQPKIVVLEEGGRPIGKTDITRLVKSLRSNPVFESAIAFELEAEYKADMDGMTNYVGTRLLKGLLVDSDLNPVTMTTRYAMSRDCNDAIYSDLVGGLGVLMEDVASHYDMIRGEDQIAEAKVRLCHRIYQKSSMKGKNRYLKYTWIKDFQDLKLAIDDDGTTDAGDAEGTDII